MKKEIPFVVFYNSELSKKPNAGKFATCRICHKKHEIKLGAINGKQSKLLAFISCGKKDYLVSLDGKLL